jgi:hypothetical protein
VDLSTTASRPSLRERLMGGTLFVVTFVVGELIHVSGSGSTRICRGVACDVVGAPVFSMRHETRLPKFLRLRTKSTRRTRLI